MRFILIIVLAAPGFAQPDSDSRLESLLAAARQAQARSDPRAAAAAYRDALTLRPESAELWSNLGLMQHESGEYVQAAEAFRKALRLNQSLIVPNLFLGLDLLELKRPKEAVPFLLAAEKLKPDDPQPALVLGRAFHALWDPEQSRKWFERAIALAPRNGEAWYGLGLAHFALAEAAGGKLTRSFRESTYVAELSAAAYAEQGQLTEAIHAYRALFASEAPGPRCSHASYGFVLLRQGDKAEAEEEFRHDLSSCPAARVGMARLQFESGAREQGLAMLADLAKSDPEGFHEALPRFWEGVDTRQIEELSAEPIIAVRLREGIRSGPLLEPEAPIANTTELHQLASDSFFSGHFRTTALAGERLRQKYPADPAGWYWAVRANQKLGVAALARAGEVEPGSSRIHALLGDAYLRRKMFDEAREEYSKMLAISPDSVPGLAGLAAVDFADDKLEAAQVSAEKAIARSPEDSEINLLMGEILVGRHEYTAAEPYLKRSLRARPDLVPRAHALLGRVFARTSRSKEAIEELTQGLTSDEDGSVYYQLARLYQETGDAKAAAAAFEKSQQIRDKRHALAQEMLKPIR